MPQHHEPPPRRDLSDLVRDTRVRLKMKQDELVNQSYDAETGKPVISRNWLIALETGQPSLPTKPKLQALARILEIPYQAVAAASGAQFWGQQTVWSPSGKTRALIATAENMTPEAIRRVHELMLLLEEREPSES